MMSLHEEVEKILDDYGFEHMRYSGCFDIVARRRLEYIILKVSMNIDSFQEEQATNLKTLSNNIDANAFLIGRKTRREYLDDNIIYERFEIPAATPRMLENILFHKNPVIYRFRGGLFSIINSVKMKKARKRAGLTQAELAKKAETTKKTIYEHESRNMGADHQTVVKIEKIIGRIGEPVCFEKFGYVKNKPQNMFEYTVSLDFTRFGLKTNFVHKTPFNIIAKEEKGFIIFSDAEKDATFLQRNIPYMAEFSKVTKKPVLIVTKNDSEYELPTVKEKDLHTLGLADLKKIVKNW